jgi:hypothetical protein
LNLVKKKIDAIGRAFDFEQGCGVFIELQVYHQ